MTAGPREPDGEPGAGRSHPAHPPHEAHKFDDVPAPQETDPAPQTPVEPPSSPDRGGRLRPVAVWPLLLVVVAVGLALLLAHVRPKSESPRETGPDRQVGAGAQKEAKAAGITQIVLWAAGLAGLFALLSKSRRRWLLPPPAGAPRTGWSGVETVQGTMAAVALLFVLTGELARTLTPGSIAGGTLILIPMQLLVVMMIVAITAPFAGVPNGRVQGAAESLRAALHQLGLSLERLRENTLRGLAGGVVALPVAQAAGFLGFLLYFLLRIEVPAHPVIREVATAAPPVELAVILLSAVIVVPFSEELLFRGFIYPSLRDRFGMTAGIVLSSLAFAVLHPGLPNQAATFVLGAVLCALYERGGTLVAPVVAHGFFNLAQLTMTLLLRFAV